MLGRLLQTRPKIGDAEAGEQAAHLVFDLQTRHGQGLAPTPRLAHVLLRLARNGRHRAVARFSPQPAEKRPQKNVDVDAVGLGAPAATLNRNARRMHDIDLDPVLIQGAGDPEAVEARLVAHDHAPHLMAGLHRFVLPLLDRPQHAANVPGLELA